MQGGMLIEDMRWTAERLEMNSWKTWDEQMEDLRWTDGRRHVDRKVWDEQMEDMRWTDWRLEVNRWKTWDEQMEEEEAEYGRKSGVGETELHTAGGDQRQEGAWLVIGLTIRRFLFWTWGSTGSQCRAWIICGQTDTRNDLWSDWHNDWSDRQHCFEVKQMIFCGADREERTTIINTRQNQSTSESWAHREVWCTEWRQQWRQAGCTEWRQLVRGVSSKTRTAELSKWSSHYKTTQLNDRPDKLALKSLASEDRKQKERMIVPPL